MRPPLFSLLQLAFICATMLNFSVAAQSAEKPVEKRNPVILVHGFKDTAAKMQPLARALRKPGWTVFTPTLTPSWGQASIEEMARQLADFIDANLPRHAHFDLVGFSMGGIVSRYYLQRLGGLKRVDRFVAISVPQHGTWLAYLCPTKLFRWPGVAQLRPHSPFLNDLNSDADQLQRLQFTSFWTPLDLMILPASSSRMPFGREKKMWVVAHPLMVWQPGCHRAVVEALTKSVSAHDTF